VPTVDINDTTLYYQRTGQGPAMLFVHGMCGDAEVWADQARRFAEHNVADWRAAGAKRIIVLDPHDYITFTEDYPRYFGDAYDFEIVLVIELVAELIRDGRLTAIPGRPPDLVDPPEGCRFAERCPYREQDSCASEPQELRQVRPGHWVRTAHPASERGRTRELVQT